jgi:hypothetical protein
VHVTLTRRSVAWGSHAVLLLALHSVLAALGDTGPEGRGLVLAADHPARLLWCSVCCQHAICQHTVL